MRPEFHLGSWSFSSYFIIISLDFCLMLFWLKHRSKKLGFPVKRALDVGMISALTGLIIARLFHVFYEFPQYYLENPSAVFKVWEGGYVILPGLMGAFAVGLLWLKRTEGNLLSWLDLFAPILALGYSLGRWACFFQGCCYGKQTDSLIGVHFHQLLDSGETIGRYPTQIFASLGELIVFIVLLFLEKYGRDRLKPGQLFGFWLMGHGLNRMVMEVFRDDPRGPLLFNLGVSFWIALSLVGVGSIFMKSKTTTSNQSISIH